MRCLLDEFANIGQIPKFLGGQEQTTLKGLSEVLGKETIDLYDTSDTRGSSWPYGLNYQNSVPSFS